MNMHIFFPPFYLATDWLFSAFPGKKSHSFYRNQYSPIKKAIKMATYEVRYDRPDNNTGNPI